MKYRQTNVFKTYFNYFVMKSEYVVVYCNIQKVKLLIFVSFLNIISISEQNELLSRFEQN